MPGVSPAAARATEKTTTQPSGLCRFPGRPQPTGDPHNGLHCRPALAIEDLIPPVPSLHCVSRTRSQAGSFSTLVITRDYRTPALAGGIPSLCISC